MTNPLFERRPKKDAKASSPDAPPDNALFAKRPLKSSVFTEASKAFSFILPPGWEAIGKLQVEKPNNRYIVFNARGPDDALVFAGHPDLPQRYLVPGHWHGFLQPGRRTKFGEGPTEQYLFPGPLASAPQMCVQLATARFGQIVPFQPEFLPQEVETMRQGAARAGVQLAFIDACSMGFSNPDRSRFGLIKLVVFGGGNPGDTWQVENIAGYWCPFLAKDATALAYKTMMDSLKTGEQWLEDHPDEVSQGFHDKNDAELRAIQKKEQVHAIGINKEIGEIKKSALDFMKSKSQWNR